MDQIYLIREESEHRKKSAGKWFEYEKGYDDAGKCQTLELFGESFCEKGDILGIDFPKDISEESENTVESYRQYAGTIFLTKIDEQLSQIILP